MSTLRLLERMEYDLKVLWQAGNEASGEHRAALRAQYRTAYNNYKETKKRLGLLKLL